MDNIFEILIQIVMAYFQIIMIAFGALFFAFGVSAFLSVAQRKNAKRHWFTASVVAVREGEGMSDENGVKGKIYYPIFEGVGPDGNTHQYEYQSGSSNWTKYKIGNRFQVSVKEGDDNFVLLKEDDKNDMIIGVFLCAIGALLSGIPIIFISISKLSFAVWAVTTLFMIFKFSKHIKPKAMRETMAQFKARRGLERFKLHQAKPEVTQDYLQEKSKKIEAIGNNMTKVSLVAGFIILCLGGAGYNSQLEFIDNAVLEKSGPCGLQLGEDCRRPILYQDALSMMPIELRPVMEGIYRSKYEPDKIIVSYGRWTPLPYFILMSIGALTILGAIRRTKKRI